MPGCFLKLKHVTGDQLQLATFNPNCKMHTNVDASGVGLGATLMQIQHSKEVIISAGSHTWTLAEWNYSTAERKCSVVSRFGLNE